MKPVLSKTFGKNGDVIENFAPTAKQILFALSKAQNPTLSDNEILDQLGIHRNSLYQWKTKYGHKFTEFVEEMIDSHAPDKGAELLEAVGMVEALQGSFNHWKEMSKIKGLIKDEVKSLTLNINTSFEHVAIGDFNEERARILSEYRGVGKSGKSRVVDVTPLEHEIGDQSAGSGTGQMQDGQVALVDSLGVDRGQPRKRKPVPAVPK